MENRFKKYKIMCFPLPAEGHNNPLYPILNELINEHKNVEVIVYTHEKFRKNFENIGAVYKNLDFDESKIICLEPTDTKQFQGFNMMGKFLNFGMENSEYIAKEIDKQQPDLILYDYFAFYLNWALVYYKSCYEKARNLKACDPESLIEFIPKRTLPPLIAYNPSFAVDYLQYPNKTEFSLILRYFDLWSFKILWHLIIYLYVYLKICLKLRFGFTNPFKYMLPKPIDGTCFIMTTIFPELQPRAHLFNTKFYKFIGSTINDNINNKNYSLNQDKKIEKILNGFEIKENKVNILDESTDKLIYVSLGTLFNNNITIFKQIFEAFETFDLEPVENKSNNEKENLKIIVSTGEEIFNKFQKLINRNEYLLSDNIVLVKTAPQTEILKRASLFVTHCGMNSTSESIHYGGKMGLN
jgi:hypothetical protein